MQGGEIEAKGMSSLPRNRQQIVNYRRVEKKKDDNVLYSVMLECKLVQGTQEVFVKDVKAAPDPQCILYFDWQMIDMVRFVTTDKMEQCGIDPTYNRVVIIPELRSGLWTLDSGLDFGFWTGLWTLCSMGVR